MSILLPLVYILLFFYIIYKTDFFYIPSLPKHAITVVFIFKIIAGTILWWLYTYRFSGADLLDYFNDGKTLFDVLMYDPQLFFQIVFNGASYPDLHSWNDSFEHVLYNDAHTMIVLNAVLHFFSMGYFHVHTVFMCFLSLVGLTALYKTFLPYFSDGKKIFFAIIFLIPSVLFWSSGVLKEGLLFFGIGAFIYSTNCGFKIKYTWRKITAIIFSIIILLLIKFYVLIALLPGFLLNVWVSRSSKKWIAIKYLTIVILFLSAAFLLSTINVDYNPLKIIAEKQAKIISEAQGGVFLVNDEHFIRVEYEKKEEILIPVIDSVYTIKKGSTYLQWQLDNMADTTFVSDATDTAEYKLLYQVTPAKTTVKLKPLQPTFVSVLQHAPTAFLTVAIQPLVWKAKGFVQLLPALENIFFIGLLIITILFFKRKIENRSLIIFCLSFVVILYVLIGITTPVIGAMIRYKIPALLFLCIALLLLMDRKKIAKKIPSIAKWLE